MKMYITLAILSILSFVNCLNVTRESGLVPENIYCHHPDCSMPYMHTMCVAAGKQSPRLYAAGMTPWMRYQILMLHNRHRDNIAMGLEAGQPPACNMRKMYWDTELEEMAELWARQCQKRHDECRNTLRFNVLQNIDVRPIVPRMTEAQLLSDAVDSWYSGARMLSPESVLTFKLSNCSAPGGCNAHWYSAAAWASTWRLGCSQAFCTAQKQACSLYRKKRTMMNSNDTSEGGPSTLNILSRPSKPSKPTRQLEEFLNAEARGKGSPLHRGVYDIVQIKKRKERKFLSYIVCNYGPGGNIEGFPIYKTGLHCTYCPEGTQCNDLTHRALCSMHSDPDSINLNTKSQYYSPQV